MKWVSGIAWTGQNYIVETVNKNRVTGTMPVEGLADLKYVTKATRRIRVATNLTSLRSVNHREYLAALGFPSETKNGQTVYQFEIEGKIYQVPAVVFMKAFFRPLGGLVPHLFRPQSLENIIFADGAEKLIRFFCKPHTQLAFNQHRSSTGIQDALSWLYCFPSARRLWDSVIDYARAGLLSFQLPKGFVNLVLQAFDYNGKWFITSIKIINLSTTEVPFEFASSHDRQFKFHHAHIRHTSEQLKEKQLTNLLCRNGQWSLSDEEWSTIEPIVRSQRSTKNNLREFLNYMLVKFGQLIAWRNLDVKGTTTSAVVSVYRKLKRDGRWDRMLEVLQELRKQS